MKKMTWKGFNFRRENTAFKRH